MYNVKTFNAIAQEGLDEFRANYQLNQTTDADAFLIRSVDLHGYNFPQNLKAIVRCGAGFNNIPLDVATTNGTAVFNTPGSNANAVKELVVAMLIIASRNLFLRHDTRHKTLALIFPRGQNVRKRNSTAPSSRAKPWL